MKSLGRAILEIIPFRLGRLSILSRQLEEEKRLVRAHSQSLAIPGLRDSDLQALREKKRDVSTAFILGTGATVNRLGPNHFKTISESFSIGINQWAVHDFIPDVYLYEFDEDSAIEDQFLRSDVIEASPLILVLRMRSENELEIVRGRRVLEGQRFRIYGRVNVWSRTTRNTPKEWDFLLRKAFTDPDFSILPDNGASVARALSIAVSLGFRRIVMLGVDLANTSYFWQEDDQFLIRRGLSTLISGQKGVIHETMETSNRALSIADFFESISKWMFESRDISLFSGSATSALAKFLPIFDWSLTEGDGRGVSGSA